MADRDTTDQALSRLVQRGSLQRVGRGLYYYPRKNDRLGVVVPPDLDDLADALARQTGSKIAPSGAIAANRLGLSTQVPARLVYLTDGRTRNVRVGGYTFQIKHTPPKELPLGSWTSALVFQALRYLGQDAVTDSVVRSLRTTLTAAQRRDLLRDARYAADWIAKVARQIAAPKPEALDG